MKSLFLSYFIKKYLFETARRRNMEKYYRLPLQKVLESVESSQKGLTQQQAQQRLHKYGKNVLQESKKKNTFVIFLEQFKDRKSVV